ncbi:NAD-glutamate dehydrogenase [Fulvimarina sp. MAC8]|uniref:NAD-glutamate dehydrogenase n=1 Tax=Fulvimarina sp. MAC8 TaxID=3162874 RepID=UPI0032F031FB
MDKPVGPTKAELLQSVIEQFPEGDAAVSLAPLLFARPPVEDLRAFEINALVIAVGAATECLQTHDGQGPIVYVKEPDGFEREGDALQLVTIVTRDMPFLFDSIAGEIAARSSTIHYISHPILDVRRSPSGGISSFETAAHLDVDGVESERISVIQFALDRFADPNGGQQLRESLERILGHVRLANRDFGAMRERADKVIADLRKQAERVGDDEKTLVLESAELLQWLRDDNFIFLGSRVYGVSHEDDGDLLSRREDDSLGILSDPTVSILGRQGQPTATTPEIRAFLETSQPMIVTKANAQTKIHRRAYMDYVGIKQYDDNGGLRGEVRFVGLFTSSAYTRSILSIPYLRLKAETVIARSGFRADSHSGKALLNVLEAYPRDEVFQIDPKTLEEFATTTVGLNERPRIKIMPRHDRFDRFVSIMVYVPRERYDSRLREQIGARLADAYEGRVSAYYPAFPEGPLARVHIIIGRRSEELPEVDVEAIEEQIRRLARNWADTFQSELAHAGRYAELADFSAGLPESYRDVIAPEEAVSDVGVIAGLTSEAPLSLDFYRRSGDAETMLRLKIFHLGDAVSLSTRVPILENMGFSVVSERTFDIRRPDGEHVHLHDMDLQRRSGGDIHLNDDGKALEETFSAVWARRIENDGFNALVLESGLDHRQANVLRAYGRYLRQGGLTYSADFLAETLTRRADFAKSLFDLFDRALDPDSPDGESADFDCAEKAKGLPGVDAALIERAVNRGVADLFTDLVERLDAVDSIDDDRILRHYASAILATLRTNYFAIDGTCADLDNKPGEVEPALAFKFDSAAVEGLPQPVPFREIFVFDARVEGVHLRFGKVARGGLRWSDRAQDYRTEVLGLVKAQQVKNAVIVPVGAKGGFYPKRLPDPAADREAWFNAGKSAYVVFIASLLSITDNISGTDIIAPERVRRIDGDDPYFVVAADKGTATFSDTANAIAQSVDFWLDDAFASGGSVGYDHKAMGITARGAWEAVKRHFREMNHDIQSEPFTAVGCGDMSGDVFGNGMLLSHQTKLIAAFDHRDIFIDPDPDPETSYAERKRLFGQARSSWADYDEGKISKGGGVFSRKNKRITLSPEAREAIGFDKESGTPPEIISAILKSPADLLWFGGIGTYIRAASESNSDVGDRANDAVRVTAHDVRAKVVGEGANLGVTQRGRIEFARGGGRINSDAIDNSAGVNTSDVEVNIKIALKSAMEDGRLEREARNKLLASMTENVSKLVLVNNYEQTLAISLDARKGDTILPLQSRFMAALEETGDLDRAVEVLPPDGAIADLKATGGGLTRPEIAVLLAYSKLTLFDQLVDSDLPDDPYLEDRLHDYFPSPMRRDYARDIEGHRLKREIVATILSNELANRCGPTFLTVVREATGASPSRIVRGFVAARDGLDAASLYDRIDELDTKIDGQLQNDLYEAVAAFLRRSTRWFVRNESFSDGLTGVVVECRNALEQLKPKLLDLASDASRAETKARAEKWVSDGVPQDLAEDLALLPLVALVPDIAAVSRETAKQPEAVMATYFGMTERFEIGRLESAIFGIEAADYYEILALDRSGSQIAEARRKLTETALKSYGDADDPVAAWSEDQGDHTKRISNQIRTLTGSGEASVPRLTVAAGLLADLAG